MATLRAATHQSPMPTTTATTASDWPPERIERLARALLPLVFAERAAPAPATAANAVQLADYRRSTPPCPD